ncbi:hypothetical protein EVAR_42751_1, partial [Eumeta japonica]
ASPVIVHREKGTKLSNGRRTAVTLKLDFSRRGRRKYERIRMQIRRLNMSARRAAGVVDSCYSTLSADLRAYAFRIAL